MAKRGRNMIDVSEIVSGENTITKNKKEFDAFYQKAHQMVLDHVISDAEDSIGFNHPNLYCDVYLEDLKNGEKNAKKKRGVSEIIEGMDIGGRTKDLQDIVRPYQSSVRFPHHLATLMTKLWVNKMTPEELTFQFIKDNFDTLVIEMIKNEDGTFDLVSDMLTNPLYVEFNKKFNPEIRDQKEEERVPLAKVKDKATKKEEVAVSEKDSKEIKAEEKENKTAPVSFDAIAAFTKFPKRNDVEENKEEVLENTDVPTINSKTISKSIDELVELTSAFFLINFDVCANRFGKGSDEFIKDFYERLVAPFSNELIECGMDLDDKNAINLILKLITAMTSVGIWADDIESIMEIEDFIGRFMSDEFENLSVKYLSKPESSESEKANPHEIFKEAANKFISDFNFKDGNEITLDEKKLFDVLSVANIDLELSDIKEKKVELDAVKFQKLKEDFGILEMNMDKQPPVESVDSRVTISRDIDIVIASFGDMLVSRSNRFNEFRTRLLDSLESNYNSDFLKEFLNGIDEIFIENTLTIFGSPLRSKYNYYLINLSHVYTIVVLNILKSKISEKILLGVDWNLNKLFLFISIIKANHFDLFTSNDMDYIDRCIRIFEKISILKNNLLDSKVYFNKEKYNKLKNDFDDVMGLCFNFYTSSVDIDSLINKAVSIEIDLDSFLKKGGEQQ